MDRDKTWALNQLRHQRNAFLLGLAAQRLLNSEQVNALAGRLVVLKGNHVVFDPEKTDRTGKRLEVRFQQVVDTYQNDHSNFLVDLEELLNSARRNLVKESYEAVKAFAKHEGIQDDLRNEPWYPFAHSVRNAISHDMRWTFLGKAKQLLPTTWEGVTIDESLEGQELIGTVLAPERSMLLVIAMAEFVKRH